MSNYPNVDKYDETGKPPALPPGSYIVKVDDIRETDKKGDLLHDKDGNEYTAFIFAVEGHPNKLFERFYFNETGPYAEIRLGKFKQFLIATGNSTTGGNLGQLLGATCRVHLQANESNGKVYNNIGEFQPLNEGEQFGSDDEQDLPY